MIKKIKAVYVDETGQKTEECLVLEILVNNKGQPDFKTKESFGFCKVVNEDTDKLESYPFVAIYTNDQLLCDFGDTYTEYSKEQMETPTKPKFIRYLHILTKDFDPKVGKKVLLFWDGKTWPYVVVKVEDFK
jgi:hypothetical protein